MIFIVTGDVVGYAVGTSDRSRQDCMIDLQLFFIGIDIRCNNQRTVLVRLLVMYL